MASQWSQRNAGECSRGTLMKRSLQIWHLRLDQENDYFGIYVHLIFKTSNLKDFIIKKAKDVHVNVAAVHYSHTFRFEMCVYTAFSLVKEHLVSSAFPSLHSDNREIVEHYYHRFIHIMSQSIVANSAFYKQLN